MQLLVLGLDSATNVAGVALTDNDMVLAEFFLNTGKTHSQRLLPLLQQILEFAGFKLQDIDLLAVTSGPGSFTGLRIGLTTIKTLAQVSGKPLVGVPTLDALAMNLAGFAGLVCPILNARKNEVYTAVYHRSGSNDFQRLTDYLAVPPAELVEIIKNLGEDAVAFLGDAVPVYRAYLDRELGPRASWAFPSHNLPRAAQVALLADRLYRQGTVEDLYRFSPLYIRPSEAEVRLAARRRRGKQ